MRRKFTRDILGITGIKNLRGLFSALPSPTARPVALRILASQAVIITIFTAIGRPELCLFLWLLPWLTVWKVFNRLRAIAEHGWHLAHHVDSGVPFRNLPRLQRELEAAGYVSDALIWPSYTALWQAMANGRPVVTARA